MVRKGAIREWMGVLDEQEQEECWNLAGELLTSFGYTRAGDLEPFSTASL